MQEFLDKTIRDSRVIELYTRDKWGAQRIAKLLGIGKRTVFRILKNHNIPTDSDRKPPNFRHDINDDELIRLYRTGASTQEIATSFAVDPETIRLRLSHNNIVRRSPADSNTKIPMGMYQSVIDWYVNDKLSTYEISERLSTLKIHPNSIQSFLTRRGLLRTPAEAYQLSAKKRATSVASSKIENMVASFLEQFGIQFVKQYELDGWIFDFRCGSILIEVQGEYWHRLPQRVQRDQRKQEVAYNNGYKLIVVWEREIRYRPQLIQARLRNSLNPVAAFNFKTCDIRIIPWGICKSFLDEYHYQKCGRSGLNIGCYCGDRLTAVATYCCPHRIEIANKQNVDYNEILELSRLCIHPDYQCKNFATWFLAKSRFLIPQSIKILVAFSDTSYGHQGTIYKADNWLFDGSNRYGYWYVDKKRNIIHKKTVWNKAKLNGINESEQASRDGLKKVRAAPKLRFIKKL